MSNYNDFEATVARPSKSDFKSIKVVIDDNVYNFPFRGFNQFISAHTNTLKTIALSTLHAVVLVQTFRGANGENIIVQVICDEDAYDAASSEYRINTKDCEQRFRYFLEKTYGTSNYPKRDALISKAWEIGESPSFEEVEYEYSELVKVIIL